MGKKGLPKTGGRKKGCPNKKTQELRECAERLGVNPFEVLLLFAEGNWKALGYNRSVIAPPVRARAAAEACQYLHPKRKAIEHSGEIKSPESELSDLELDRRIQSLMKKE